MKDNKFLLLLLLLFAVSFSAGITADRAYLHIKGRIVKDSIDYPYEIRYSLPGGRIPGDDTVAGRIYEVSIIRSDANYSPFVINGDTIANGPKEPKRWHYD